MQVNVVNGLFTLGPQLLFLSLISKVLVPELVDESLVRVVVMGQKFIVPIELIGHPSFGAEFDLIDWCFAGIGDSENGPQLHDHDLLGELIPVQVLLADSGVVAIGLDH